MKKIILLLPILILSGCAYYQPTAVSTNSIGGKYERPTGIAQGVASRFYFFPCYAACPSGEDSLKAAIDDALIGRNADTLANVFVDRKTIYFPHMAFPLFIRHDVIVTGTLVKYNTEEFVPDDDKFPDIVNSKNFEMILDTLLNFNRKQRKSLLRNLPDDAKNFVYTYLIEQENKKLLAENEKDLFSAVVGRPAYLDSYNKITYTDKNNCHSYNCLLDYKNKERKKKFMHLTKKEKADVINTAKKRIRACFPEKTPSVVVDIEKDVYDNEKEFLEFLCKKGHLSLK